MADQDNDDRGRPITRGSQWSGSSGTYGDAGGSSSYGGGRDDRDDRRGGGGGRSYGGGGDMKCFNCQGTGHKSYECSEPRQEGGGRRDGGGYGDRESRGPTTCFNCGGEGHKSFECSAPRQEGGGRRDGGGFSSRREDGGGYQPPRDGGYGGRRDGGDRESRGPTTCFNCGGDGHKSFECSAPRQEGAGPPRRDGGGYRGRDGGEDREGGYGAGGRERRAPDVNLDALQISDPSRPRLQLARRGAPAASVPTPPVSDAYAKKSGGSNPFGDARPREVNLIAAGKTIEPESPPRRRSSVDASAAAAAAAAAGESRQ